MPGEAEERDPTLLLAGQLCELGRFPEALSLYQRSLDLHGPSATTIHAMGICHYQMGRLGDALRCMEEALLLDPRSEAARVARIRVQAEIERRGRAGVRHVP